MLDDDECGAIGGMRLGRGNRSTRRKPAPVPLCPPQIPHALTGLEPGDKPPTLWRGLALSLACNFLAQFVSFFTM
jgi:hypothetical protein